VSKGASGMKNRRQTAKSKAKTDASPKPGVKSKKQSSSKKGVVKKKAGAAKGSTRKHAKGKRK
ncbi:MAG TPA: hypothetical protein VN604_09095, partial [Nitrospirota bacterium]|nr:hypothetical protein [Nitrospirota bacterium]